jgi:hypothetical protein
MKAFLPSTGKPEIYPFLKQNRIFLPFLVLLLLLIFLYPAKVSLYPGFVDWLTIANLTGLLIVVTAVQQSAVVGDFHAGF